MVKNIICFDLETTTLDVKNSYIIEIGWITYNIETKQIFENNYVLDVPVEINNSHIHGIKKQDTIGKFLFEEIIDGFLEDYAESDLVVGFNHQFDLHCLEVELDRNNMYEKIDMLYKKKFYDVMRNSVNVCKLKGKNNSRYKFPKLQEVYFHLFGKEFEGHRAIVDCVKTLECYNKLVENFV
jgi:DNA polymerase III epsilon subunit-like protein